MADTTGRVLQLLSLLQARRSWTGGELMDRLAVSERTLRRDIGRLRDLGYPVSASTGPGGGYQLEPVADIPPLLLDEDEAIAIAVGLRTAAGGTITGIEETSARALAKLEQVLPPRIRRQVNTLQSTVASHIRPWITVDAEVLAILARACRDRERVRFEYRTRDGRVSERNVEPHHLVSLHARWYLVAFDREREDWRTFRLDRLESPWPTRMQFEPRPIPGGDPVQHVLQAMVSRPMRFRASVVVDASSAEVAHRTRGEGSVEALDDGRSRYRVQDDSLEWLALRLVYLGVDFRVEEPAELVDYLARLADRLDRSVSVSER